MPPAPAKIDWIDAKDYPSFIMAWLLEWPKHHGGRKLSYAAIAQRAGFLSRSFPREVALGKKRITAKTLEPFMRGLGLEGDQAELFRLLVMKAHADCRGKSKSPKVLTKAIDQLRNRLKKDQNHNLAMLFKRPYPPLIYAALGTPDRGASVEEIAKRTCLSEDVIKEELTEMSRLGCITCQGTRYKVVENHGVSQGLKPDEYLGFFLSCLDRAKSAATSDLESDEKLFLTSCFSVDQSKLSQLKLELRRLLHRYVDDNESNPGDRIVTLMVTLF